MDADRSTTSSTVFSFEITIAAALRSRSSTKESSCSVARLLSAGIGQIAHANRGARSSASLRAQRRKTIDQDQWIEPAEAKVPVHTTWMDWADPRGSIASCRSCFARDDA